MFTISGQTLNANPPPTGAARVIKSGFYLSIASVTLASAGEYVCLAKANDVEMIKTYNLEVGEMFSHTKPIYNKNKIKT